MKETKECIFFGVNCNKGRLPWAVGFYLDCLSKIFDE